MNQVAIAVHRYVRFPVPIIVRRHRHILRYSPAYRRHPAIRGPNE